MRLGRPILQRPVRAALIGAALLSATGPLALAGGASAAATPGVKCKLGEVPAIAGSGSNLRLVKKAGRPTCKKPPKLKQSRLEPPAASPQGAVASTADAIKEALTVNPDALAKAEKRIGKKATSALVDRALNDWRSGAKASTAPTGRRLAADSNFHFESSFGDPAKGTTASAKIDAGPAGEGGAGIKAGATIEFSADAAGLKSLGADKISKAKSAKVKLEISFEDAPTQCPTAEGKVKGKAKASVALTLTVDGVVQTMSAKIDASYELTVGDDAKWKTIDNVDVQSEFSFGGTGKGTETWRGRRGGDGFGERGIFGEGSGDFTSAINEQASHVDPRKGGVWGPRGRVLFSVPSTDNLTNYGGSIAHLKGMILTDVATTYLMYAAVEYVRQVVAPRGQKHWYDAEACLKIEGSADKAKLRPSETAKVTAKNAKAADGTPARTKQTATGAASITPGSATVAAGGTFDYTLTAPSSSPVKASWTVVALSPAGKKTVSGAIGDVPRYTVVLDDPETGTYATHTAAARMKGTLSLLPVEGSNPQRWTATGPLEWSDISSISKTDCSLISPVPAGSWTVDAVQAEADQITVKIDITANAKVNATIRCPTEEGFSDQPDFPLLIPVGFSPTTFMVPNTGGVQAIIGEVTEGGEGLRSRGSVTVTANG